MGKHLWSGYYILVGLAATITAGLVTGSFRAGLAVALGVGGLSGLAGRGLRRLSDRR